ncbi:MAG: hypothetical protein F6K17_21050, partial [Okeania sp. SIO3C4]|nr:hypothetical protein [Okeania sp. SIO3C4]
SIRFSGRDRETDVELRDRAKETLLAASGANSTSIKNALLSISGVNDVKVKENFASGAENYGIVEVIVDTADWFDFSHQENQRKLNDTIDRVRAAGVYVLLKAPKPVYLDGTFQIELASTLKPSPEERTNLEAEVQAEIISYIRNLPMGESLAIAQLTKKILDINVIDNIVDYRLFTWKEYAEGEVTITREGSLSKNLTIPANTPIVSEHKNFQTLTEVIFDENIRSVNVSVKAKLKEKSGELDANASWDNITVDMVNLTITNESPIRWKFDFSEKKRIEVQELEKLIPGKVQFASEIKTLTIDIFMKVKSLDSNKEQLIQEKLTEYFDEIKAPHAITKDEIKGKITGVTIDEIKLVPHLWNDLTVFDGETIEISFVEKATLGLVFIYENIIEVNGAIQLILPVTTKDAEKTEIYQKVRQKITEYLESLQPEEDVEVEKLVEQANTFAEVLKVEYKTEDFAGERIEVNQFEKAQLSDGFLISSDISPVKITITGLTLTSETNVVIDDDLSALESDSGKLKDWIKESMNIIYQSFFNERINQQLPKFAAGQILEYEELKNSLKILLIEFINSLPISKIEELLKQQTFEGNDQIKIQETINSNYLQGVQDSLRSSNYIMNDLELQKGEDNTIKSDIPISILEQAVIQPLKLGEDKLIVNQDLR